MLCLWAQGEMSVNSTRNEDLYRSRVYGTYISKRHHHNTTYTAYSYNRWAKASAKRFEGWLPAERETPILDLGCGHGNCLYLLQREGYLNLTGVDLGAEQLELAAQVAPTAILVQDDMFHFLETRTTQYGLIVCLNIIEHLTKQELPYFLDLLVAALLPNGRVIFETPNAESPWFGSIGYADLTHEWFFTPRGLKDVLSIFDLSDFEARPSEPVPNSGRSWVRFLVWRTIRAALSIWNVAETGSIGSGIYTRVFVATVRKKEM